MGTTLAAGLFVDADPAERLLVTFPASEAQRPAVTPATCPGVNKVVRFDEGVNAGYRYYDRAGRPEVLARALSVWNPSTDRWDLTPGLYTLSAGTSSRDLPVRRTDHPVVA